MQGEYPDEATIKKLLRKGTIEGERYRTPQPAPGATLHHPGGGGGAPCRQTPRCCAAVHVAFPTHPCRCPPAAGKFVPMCCGTAFKNKGVQPLLDAVVDYLPAPTDLPDVRGSAVDDAEKVGGGRGRGAGGGRAAGEGLAGRRTCCRTRCGSKRNKGSVMVERC